MAFAGAQRKEAVRLQPYNPEWAETGELIKKELLSVFSALAIEIRHIGSTAVPGLKARPIIDIAVAVREFKEVPQFYEQLSALGYHHKSESDSENQIFLYSQKNRFNVYVHIVIHGKTLWSGQGVLGVSVGNQSAGTTVVVKDSNGNIIISYAPKLAFQIVVISSPDIIKGESYTIVIGSTSGTVRAQ